MKFKRFQRRFLGAPCARAPRALQFYSPPRAASNTTNGDSSNTRTENTTGESDTSETDSNNTTVKHNTEESASNEKDSINTEESDRNKKGSSIKKRK